MKMIRILGTAGTGTLLSITMLAAGCGPAAQTASIPPAPILGYLPDPAFVPQRQCRGRYAVEDLQRFLPQARLALWLPGTRSVALDPDRRCIMITVESVGGGRLAELLLRGVAVPRRSVLLVLANWGRRG
jgi:hypothetical protein